MDYHRFLGTTIEIKIDRRIGSKHPTHGYRYPLNYGFIPGTEAEDGEAVDVYLLGVNHPVDKITATIVGIAHREDDDENKLIATLDGAVPPLQEIESELHFQEQFFRTTYHLIKSTTE